MISSNFSSSVSESNIAWPGPSTLGAPFKPASLAWPPSGYGLEPVGVVWIKMDAPSTQISGAQVHSFQTSRIRAAKTSTLEGNRLSFPDRAQCLFVIII
jgi:hypothetical protein